MTTRYRSFHDEIMKIFGERIFRVTVNAGLTCPNIDGSRARGGCTFCQDASYLGASFQEGLSVTEQIQKGMAYVQSRHKTGRFFAYFQNGTNTYAPVDQLRRLYNEALASPEIAGLIIATRPDCLAADVLDLLEEINRKTFLWMEVGFQSHRNDVLKRINRAHTWEEFEDAVHNLSNRKIRTCAHAIIGLPGENEADPTEKAQAINRLPVSAVKIHNLVVFKDTILEKQYRQGHYQPMDLQQYATACVDFLENLRPEIIVQRLNAHGPRSVTVAPEWSINKMATMNAIHEELEKRDTWQGKKLGYDMKKCSTTDTSLFLSL